MAWEAQLVGGAAERRAAAAQHDSAPAAGRARDDHAGGCRPQAGGAGRGQPESSSGLCRASTAGNQHSQQHGVETVAELAGEPEGYCRHYRPLRFQVHVAGAGGNVAFRRKPRREGARASSDESQHQVGREVCESGCNDPFRNHLQGLARGIEGAGQDADCVVPGVDRAAAGSNVWIAGAQDGVRGQEGQQTAPGCPDAQSFDHVVQDGHAQGCVRGVRRGVAGSQRNEHQRRLGLFLAGAQR
mmetsp:Transcript_36289/g.85317  ORF Transcript_36289/g.85317 Transcript_36289/m.85317 type:complete len:243 (+) Transcript_36289:284-1012(+)